MRKKKDYYEYWNKVNPEKTELLDREKQPLEILSRILKGKEKVLDLGCAEGDFLLEVQKRFPNVEVKGIDYSKKQLEVAKKKGLNVSFGDFEKGVKEKAKGFDVAYAGELIEHLYNPDLFLEEANRVLKDSGFLILTTPNLCAWFNRVFMLLGIQPLFLEPSTKSKLVGAGVLKKFKKEPQPVGHVRIFTKEALEDLLEMHGFEVVEMKGSIYEEGLPDKVLKIDKIFKKYPKLSSRFVVLAKKVKDV
ncbi:hypothetical protein CMI47_15380 [Candidatus Pacearchaeota archaeon]|nr:hypothetical protein [Candidatus Pacearchaeota archaeon]|tara:strand:+ start:517 stop:1260 length:744 start_codon:yes stop_codon:yes gene_type:complete